MAEAVVTQALLLAAPVTDVIGQSDDARIFVAGKAPQAAVLPYLTYQRVSTGEVVGLTLEGEFGLDAVRFQINCWDSQFNGNAMSLAQKVRQALHGKIGPGPGQQTITCSAPVDFDSDEKLQIEGARMDAVVVMNEAAEAA